MFQSPKLFLNLILIGCCYKRMWKEGAQQPIRALLMKAVATRFSFQSMAESFGRRHNILQLTHSISIYRCLWWVNHGKHEQTGLKRGDGMEISTQVQPRRRRWLKTSRQLTMKHRLRRSTLVTKVSTYHQNCHWVFHPIQNLLISTLLRVRNWRTMCREILFLTRKSFSLASDLWISNYWLILCKLYCAQHANDLWVRTVASHTHMSKDTELIRPQNLYLPASAKTNLFCLPQRNVAEFMRPTEGFP